MCANFNATTPDSLLVVSMTTWVQTCFCMWFALYPRTPQNKRRDARRLSIGEPSTCEPQKKLVFRKGRGRCSMPYWCIFRDVHSQSPQGTAAAMDFHPRVTLNSFKSAENSTTSAKLGSKGVRVLRSCLPNARELRKTTQCALISPRAAKKDDTPRKIEASGRKS